jgi:hypothetical protein
MTQRTCRSTWTPYMSIVPFAARTFLVQMPLQSTSGGRLISGLSLPCGMCNRAFAQDSMSLCCPLCKFCCVFVSEPVGFRHSSPVCWLLCRNAHWVCTESQCQEAIVAFGNEKELVNHYHFQHGCSIKASRRRVEQELAASVEMPVDTRYMLAA